MTTNVRRDVRQRILMLCTQPHDMPAIMGDPEMQDFADKFGERNVRDMVHALSKSGLIYTSGNTRNVLYVITAEGKLILHARLETDEPHIP